MISFFAIQFTFYYFKQKREDRVFFEIVTAIPIALIATLPVIYEYLKKFGIDWKVIFSTLIILVLGSLLAIAIDFTITILFSLRTEDEMKRMGLGKIPSASKAFIRCLILLFPINGAILFFLLKFDYLLPIPLNNYWKAIYISPALLLNLDTFINLLLCLGPAKIREGAINNLRKFRRAMDVHEMHYQHIGIEQPREPELPPICEFSRNGQLNEVKALLNKGTDPNTQDFRGWCPLMWASAEKRLDIVTLLLEYGADPNIINFLGRSAIMYASNYGYYEIAQALLEKGAIPNPSSEFTGLSPLSAASDKGHLDIVKLLIEHGAEVMHKDKNGNTALDIAMEAGYGEIAKHLRNKMLELDETPPHKKTDLIKNVDWVRRKSK